MNREIAKECLTNGGRKTSEEEIDRFMKEFEVICPTHPVAAPVLARSKKRTMNGTVSA